MVFLRLSDLRQDLEGGCLVAGEELGQLTLVVVATAVMVVSTKSAYRTTRIETYLNRSKMSLPMLNKEPRPRAPLSVVEPTDVVASRASSSSNSRLL